jgi:hypothetical protein
VQPCLDTRIIRDFRNYTHPRQQLAKNFVPRRITAEIAHKVLMATIADVAGLPSTSSTSRLPPLCGVEALAFMAE